MPADPALVPAPATVPEGLEPDGAGADVVVQAEELEIVLPSGAGVGPWTGSVRAGEQVLLIGPSGGGKSTLLRALAGAIPSHQRGHVTGSLRVDGLDPVGGGVLALSGSVSLLGQDPADGVCLPQVADDLALPLESRCVPPDEIGERVRGALEAAGIAPLAGRAAASLSGGQLQRAGLATALVARPRLLLLDEPTAMLDADGVAAVRRAVRRAAREDGVSTLLVEHRLDEWAGEEGLAGLPGRTIALDRDGSVLADGPTPEVLARHAAELRDAGCWLPRGLEADTAPDTAPDTSLRAPEPASGEALLELRGARLGHALPGGAERTVLEDVDLALHAGRVLAVVGPNGAGKSTLLGALSRLDAPLAGEVRGAPAGLVFQRPETQFVADTVGAELAASGASPERAARMLEELDLVPQREASPYRLSGGQQRRLSLGAMLLAERPVLLTDEPGYGLDRAAHETVQRLLRRAAEEGRAVVVTTHDLRTVRAADEVAVLVDGRLLPPRAPEELLADEDLLRRAGLRAAEAPAAQEPPSAETPSAETPSAENPSAENPPYGAVPRGGLLARRNPTVLLGLLTALSIVAVLLTDPAPLLVLHLLLGAGAMAGCRLGPLALLRAQRPFVLFALGILLVNVLTRPGHEPWPGLPVRITAEGIEMGIALALRALLIGLGAVTVARATAPRETMTSLQQHARLPARIACALLAGRRLLDELPARWATLTRAHRIRRPLTASGEVARLRPRHLLRCAFAMLVDAVRGAERLALALESRGLGPGPRTVWRPVPLGAADALLVAAVALVVGLVLVLV